MIAHRDVRYNSPELAHPPGQSRFNDELTLFVKHIPKTMGKDVLAGLFKPYGGIDNINLLVTDVFPFNRAYVTMKSKNACIAAQKGLNRWKDDTGTIIYVYFKTPFRSHGTAYSGPPQNTENNGSSGRGKYSTSGFGRGQTLLRAAALPGNDITPDNSTAGAPFSHTGNYHRGGRPQFYRPPERGSIGIASRGFNRGQGGFRGRGGGSFYNPGYPSRGGYSLYQRGHHPSRGSASLPRGDYRGGYSNRGTYPHDPYYHTPGQDAADAELHHPPPLQRIGKCLHCATTSQMRCSSCKVAPYCSRECQTKHWNESHRMECDAMREQAMSTAVDLSHFSVGVNPHVMEAMRSDPAIMSGLAEVRDSDTDSLSSSPGDGLPLNESIQVKLTDFVSPSQFFVQMLEESTTEHLPRVWECGLQGVTPSGGGKWSKKVIEVLASNGLALGGLCTITCSSRKGGTYRAKVMLRSGADLAEKLVSSDLATPTAVGLTKSTAKPAENKPAKSPITVPANSAKSEPTKTTEHGPANSTHSEPVKSTDSEPTKSTKTEPSDSVEAKHTESIESRPVKSPETKEPEKEPGSRCKVTESLHTKLEPGQIIQIVIDESSIKSVSDFYAQVIGKTVLEELKLFKEMAPKLNNYAAHIANKPPPGFKAEEGDYVLAPFDNCWFRGLVTACNEIGAAVAFIDYGNIGAVVHQELMPLPKQFCDVPAVAVQCRLHGLIDVTSGKEHAVAQIKALAGDRMKAIVRSITDVDISLDLFTYDDKNIADTLLKFGYAVSATANTQNGAQTSNSTSYITSTNEDLPPLVSAAPSSVTEDLPPLVSASSSSTNEDLPPLVTAHGSSTIVDDMPSLVTLSDADVSGNHSVGSPPPLAPFSPEVDHASKTSARPQQTASATSLNSKGRVVFKQPRRKVIYEKTFPREEMPLGFQIGVLLVNASDLDSVYIQPADRESRRTFLNAMDKLSQDISDQKAPLENMVEGEVVVVIDPISECWDRVVILHYHPDDPVVIVRSIDFGSTYEVMRNDVRELTEKASRIPMRAVNVRLSGVEGELTKEGQAILESNLQLRVIITLTEKSNQLWGDMHDPKDNSINSALRPHTRPLANSRVRSSQGLDSHGSSSDGSMNASVTTEAAPTSSASGSKESRIARLEEQLSALQMEKVLLQKEITAMRQKPRNTIACKRGTQECDDEFTL